MPNSQYEVVKSIEHLKKLCKNEPKEFKLLLAGGFITSTKTVLYENKKFFIINSVDDSEQTLTEKQLKNKTYSNIYEGIKKRAFVYLK